tara:strand:- start:1416 stop:1868 length:453 start_codon:yes stop_codon:yes gene_type:complete
MYPDDFFESIGIKLPQKPWSIHMQWSTTQPMNWVIERNSLRPEDLLLTLSINDRHWQVSLERRDEVFYAQWGTYGFRVDSQQLKYRRFIKWPAIESPENIIAFITELESLLSVRFVKHINLQGTLSGSIEKPQLLADFLKVTTDDFGVFS